MLFHMSVEADDPRQVANVIAELWGGVATRYPMVADGSWCALAGDDRNTMVVVFPRGTRLVESRDAGGKGERVMPRRGSATHMAIASDLDPESVLAIAQRESWPAEIRKRGRTSTAIEIWIEGCQLLEVMTPEMQKDYLRAMTVERWMTHVAKAEGKTRVSARSPDRLVEPLQLRRA